MKTMRKRARIGRVEYIIGAPADCRSTKRKRVPLSTQSPLAFSLQVFRHMFSSVAEEMGATMQRTAFSPNIKERRDFSCAVFDVQGNMIAQAAHIPVHLGAMPLAVRAAMDVFEAGGILPGDLVILNDPYLGGTHLPDITTVSPVFVDRSDEKVHFGYVATRAHHADVGGITPGSMPLATECYQEGLIIPPIKLVNAGVIDDALVDLICRNVRTPDERRGDLASQMAAHRVGERRVAELAERYGIDQLGKMAAELLDYSARLTRARLRVIPDGDYSFEDYLDDDGIDSRPVKIKVEITANRGHLTVDFTGTDPAVQGSVNAPAAVTQSAVYYVIRCLIGDDVPGNAGTFEPVDIRIPERSVLNPRPPHAVAGGNVETSQRVVDVVWGALAHAIPDLVPAASQGTMNNVTLGGYDPFRDKPFAYYETIGGGSGAGPHHDGASGIQVAMTNTWNTPVEAMEFALPVMIERYQLRRASGGAGAHRGGQGVERNIKLLAPAQVTLLSERRTRHPYGLAGGGPGRLGRNRLHVNGRWRPLPSKGTVSAEPGDVISISTPGGGGWGTP